jgi:transcription elongation factor GreA
MSEVPEELRNRQPRPTGQQPTANLTVEAYLRLKAEVEELELDGRQRVAERLLAARELGDLKENGEYEGLMESKIRKIRAMLRDPEIVEAPLHADEVGPGMLVTIRPLDEDDPDDETYLLAEHAEERAKGARTVTTTSPLGSALMGATVDTEVLYEAPGGNFRYVVVAFEPHTG